MSIESTGATVVTATGPASISRMRAARLVRLFVVFPAAGFVILGLGACESDRTADPEDAAQVLEMFEEYLPRLALAYSTGETSVLEGFAAEKEIAGMDGRIRDLRNESREIHPTFRSVQLEDVKVWRHVNAYATTLEVWDLQVVAEGTDIVLSEVYNQSNRVKYQLKRRDGSWIVLFRQIEDTFQ